MTVTYETDFYLWTQQQADLIRRGLFSELDTAHLAEEIEDMGRSEKRELENRLIVLLMHLLKWRHQPERRGHSWQATIKRQRLDIEDLLQQNPSLKPTLSSALAGSYRKARLDAVKETDLPLATFPEPCPFTVEHITGDYWPD